MWVAPHLSGLTPQRRLHNALSCRCQGNDCAVGRVRDWEGCIVILDQHFAQKTLVSCLELSFRLLLAWHGGTAMLPVGSSFLDIQRVHLPFFLRRHRVPSLQCVTRLTNSHFAGPPNSNRGLYKRRILAYYDPFSKNTVRASLAIFLFKCVHERRYTL